MLMTFRRVLSDASFRNAAKGHAAKGYISYMLQQYHRFGNIGVVPPVDTHVYRLLNDRRNADGSIKLKVGPSKASVMQFHGQGVPSAVELKSCNWDIPCWFVPSSSNDPAYDFIYYRPGKSDLPTRQAELYFLQVAVNPAGHTVHTPAIVQADATAWANAINTQLALKFTARQLDARQLVFIGTSNARVVAHCSYILWSPLNQAGNLPASLKYLSFHATSNMFPLLSHFRS